MAIHFNKQHAKGLVAGGAARSTRKGFGMHLSYAGDFRVKSCEQLAVVLYADHDAIIKKLQGYTSPTITRFSPYPGQSHPPR